MLGLWSALAQPCENEYSANIAICNSAQGQRDQEIGELYNAMFDAAEALYDAALEANQAAYDAVRDEAQETLYEKIGDPNEDPNTVEGHGSCGEAAAAGYAAADAQYNLDWADCIDAYPSSTAYCICYATAHWMAANVEVIDDLAKCTNDANNEYARVMNEAFATKTSSDHSDAAAFHYSAGQAAAAREASLILSSTIASVCGRTANLQYGNCALALDCFLHSENCCVDSCGIARNNSLLAVWNAFDNELGEASATLSYTLIMCAATHTRDDFLSYSAYLLAYWNGGAAFAFGMADAESDHMYAINRAEHVYDRRVAVCNCQYTESEDLEAYQSCVEDAASQRDAARESADTAYYALVADPTGTVVQTWNTLKSQLSTTLTADYQAHQSQDDACRSQAQSSYDEIYDSAVTYLNAAIEAIEHVYYHCVNACNG